MKFVQFTYPPSKDIRVGYVDQDYVVDIQNEDPTLPNTMLEILQNNDVEKVKRIQESNPKTIPLSSVHLKAPITDVDKVLCVGMNYYDFCEAYNFTVPDVPVVFNKFPSCIVGPKDPVRLRTETTSQVDFEIELALVIGKEATNVDAFNAWEYIFGYTIAQDLGAKDWLAMNGGQNLLGKAMDDFCPLGPWIVTAEEVGNPHNLALKCKVDGVVKQDSNTDRMIAKIPNIIQRLTKVMTLLPGDVILTGTPAGIGSFRDPPEFVKPGSVVKSEIEKIGLLTTRFVKF